MRNETIDALSATPPPAAAPAGKLKCMNLKASWEIISRLEVLAGQPQGERIFNIIKANERISELEVKLADRISSNPYPVAALLTPPTAAAALAPPPTALQSSITPIESLSAFLKGAQITIDQYLGASTEARSQFAADGGQVTVEVFNSMPKEARQSFHSNGGKIVLGDTKLKRNFSPDPIPANANLMSLTVFNRLGKNDQANALRLGVRLGG